MFLFIYWLQTHGVPSLAIQCLLPRCIGTGTGERARAKDYNGNRSWDEEQDAKFGRTIVVAATLASLGRKEGQGWWG